MEKYKLLTLCEKSNLKKGDKIKLIEDHYIEYPGGAWLDHFGKKRNYYVVLEMPSNNSGSFKVKNHKKQIRWIDIYHKEIYKYIGA